MVMLFHAAPYLQSRRFSCPLSSTASIKPHFSATASRLQPCATKCKGKRPQKCRPSWGPRVSKEESRGRRTELPNDGSACLCCNSHSRSRPTIPHHKCPHHTLHSRYSFPHQHQHRLPISQVHRSHHNMASHKANQSCSSSSSSSSNISLNNITWHRQIRNKYHSNRCP